MIRAAALLLCLAAGAAEANTVGCGGNSYSFAEVVTAPRARVSKDAPRPRARRGDPILVVPHSLCADLIEERRSVEPSHIDVEIPLPGGTANVPLPDRRRPRR